MADSIAAFLGGRGVGPGDRVGILSTKSVAEVAAIYGILRAGAAFVHVNPQYREAHLRHVVDNCGLTSLFVDGARWRLLCRAYSSESPFNLIVRMGPLPEIDAGGLPDPAGWEEVLATTGGPRTPSPSDGDLAAVIYTSGSTGMPKGIMVSHRVFRESTEASARVLENRKEDRLISVTPFSFDGALSQLFTAVMVGGTLVQQGSTFPNDIVRTLREERITGFHAMPSLWATLLGERSTFSDFEYPDLRYISIIGEKLPSKEAFRSTYLPPDRLDDKPGSVGIPFPGVRIRVLGDGDEELPAGEVGLIAHSGAFVASGYWGDPERTERVFRDGEVRTGDMGWVDQDGFLHFTGRKDNLLKIRGFRVSPDEVESCLHALPGIDEAVAIPALGPDEQVLLKAVVVPSPSSVVEAGEILAHCRRTLPPYMIPDLVELRDSLPRTANGKVDRTQLK
jgi:acyl-CoA synthetase (AMP-forming)/AMP-acid ligase II